MKKDVYLYGILVFTLSVCSPKKGQERKESLSAPKEFTLDEERSKKQAEAELAYRYKCPNTVTVTVTTTVTVVSTSTHINIEPATD